MSIAAEVERRRWRRAIALTLGLLLVAGAVWMLVNNRGAVEQSVRALGSAPWWCVVLLLVLPLVNIASVAGSFWVMTEPHARRGVYGRLSLREMAALITSGWMLNSLPLRPGLVGRVGYHAVVNGVAVRTSVLILIRVLACSAGALGCMLATLWAAKMTGAAFGSEEQSAGVWSTGVLLALVAIVALWRRARPEGWAWRYGVCVICRVIDIHVWAVRYGLIFVALGKPIGVFESGVVASTSAAAMLSPVQIGLREWVVGLTAGWLASVGGIEGVAGGVSVSTGLLADLVNRSIELALGVPLGLIAGAWLAKRASTAASRGGGRTIGGTQASVAR